MSSLSPASVLLLALCAAAAAAAAASAPATLTLTGPATLTLANGYVRADVDLARPSVAFLAGDFLGQGRFGHGAGAGVLASPIRLEREDAAHRVCSSADGAAPDRFKWTVLQNDTDKVEVRLDGIVDCAASPLAEESWTLGVSKDSRSLSFAVTGRAAVASTAAAAATTDPPPASIVSVRRVVALHAVSLYAFFDRGVVQMMNANIANWFHSTDGLPRWYALGGGTSLDVQPADGGTTLATGGFLLGSNVEVNTGSVLQYVLAGTPSSSSQDKWGAGWSAAQPVPSASALPAGGWSAAAEYAPNNKNFPAGGLTTGPNLPPDDLEALLTGVYASSPGNLCTYDNEVVPGERVAQIATTIAFPGRGYQDTYNYFDPDNYIALSSLLYSGDPYLQHQARLVVERSGAFLKQNATDPDDPSNGQLPHHFNKDKPTYLALSGATQTGPNTFWVKTALRYADVTGDSAWLAGYIPTLRNASDFCFDLIEPDPVNLLKAPGSLMIDVFVRANFTADSNAMMVGFLRDFAKAERAVGSTAKAAQLEAQAERVRTAMNAQLWASQDGGADHYLTQRNPDGTHRDFVDYDANAIAVAHGVPATRDDALRVLKRIDQGACAAAQGGGPQWVSEVYYDKANCVGGNIGDSATAMGRIALFDAHARKRVGGDAQQQAFDAQLATLQRDLIAYTWMHERYTCDGQMMGNRTNYYFEYPSTVAMLLREVRYGIDVGLLNVTVAPFGPTNFTYDVGNVYVQYDSPGRVSVSVPGTGSRGYTVGGLEAGATYDVDADGGISATADADGILHFDAAAGQKVTATLRREGRDR